MIDDATHREARDCFVSAFNACYPDWKVYRKNRDLKPRDIDYAALRSYRGKCGPRSGGRVYFGVKKKFWDSVDHPRQVALIIHELGHVKVLDHSPKFWELVSELFWDLYDNRNVLEQCFDNGVMQSEKEWDKVKEHLVFNPTTHMVDNRSETVTERRKKMKELLEWDGDVGAWSGVSLSTFVNARHDSIRVSTDNILIPPEEQVTTEELLEWFENPWRRNGVKVDDRGYRYRVEPFVVECVDGDFVESDYAFGSGVFERQVRVVDGFKRAQLYKKVYNEATIRCKIDD